MNVNGLFREVVRKNADRPAVAFSPAERLTYAELDRLSDLAAHYLLEQGVREGDRIGLCLEKSASFYILVLAALKIGAPYFALDPRNPASRMAAMIGTCAPRILFSHLRLEAGAVVAPNHLCPEGSKLPQFCQGGGRRPLPAGGGPNGSGPAYIMFTSGSTGTPKGAVISRDNLLHFIRWAQSAYGFTPDDSHTHLNPVYFDNSVFDVYSALFSGGRLVPFTQATLINPAALTERLRDMGCTAWFSVPSLLVFLQVMKAVTPEHFGGLKKIIFGGEGFPKPKLKALMDELGTNVEYHNVSGPTECTCICTTYRVERSDLDSPEALAPLGALLPHFKGFILNGDLSVQPGETGELCLSGPCVGQGYYAQPELTRQAFVQNPLNRSEKEIIYRTGDLVRLNPGDNKLYFMGRKDLQIKHMGYRIELEEIQHALSRCHRVDESAVVYRQDRGQGEIVAIIAARQSPDLGLLRIELAEHIPAYMMPAQFHFLERLPKNGNGKTDRQALIRQYGG